MPISPRSPSSTRRRRTNPRHRVSLSGSAERRAVAWSTSSPGRAAVGCVAALALVLALPAAATADPGPYVALGDSYTAAPLVPSPTGAPLGCLRSDHDYPSLVARALVVARLRDVSCFAARTGDMTAPQTVSLGSNPAQFGALDRATRLVTIGIGGDDEGLVGVAERCLELGLLAPTASACRDRYAPGGVDAIAARIADTAPRVAAVLRGIRERAPLARVVVVGYPDVAPHDGRGCWPLVTLSDDDVRYFDGMVVRTNAMLAEQSEANGDEFVDTYDDSIGHDVCTLPGRRWFEGVVPTAVAFPLHPNAAGVRSMARSVLRVLRSPRPGPVSAKPRAPGRPAVARRHRSRASGGAWLRAGRALSSAIRSAAARARRPARRAPARAREPRRRRRAR